MPTSELLVIVKCPDCAHQASGLTSRAVIEALADHRRWESIKPVELHQ